MTSGTFLFFRRLRRPLILLIASYAVCIIGFVIIPGINGRNQPVRLDFFDAFYIVSYTGSTIGFGELPYPFTGTQRLWMVFTIYVTVIVWLYSIGSIIAILQDPTFQRLIRERRFINYVRRMDMPFHLVCGYGETGSLLVRELIRYRLAAVVIDVSHERIDAMDVEDLGMVVPSFPYNASHPESLVNAGLTHPLCQGVVAVTENNEVNLAVAMAVRLLNPSIPATCRANDAETAAIMASFNTKSIINPFAVFAERLALAFQAPSAHMIYEWLTSSHRGSLTKPTLPPTGHWVVCGYGRFGKAVYERLTQAGNHVTVIEVDPEGTDVPPDAVRHGRGTEAPTLIQAGVLQAVGIVAGSENGIHNLSVIVTARELNPRIFTIARQIMRHNNILFKNASLDMWVQPPYLTASEAVAVLRNPLLTDFLGALQGADEQWAAVLVDRFARTIGEASPEIWAVEITLDAAPAI